MRYRLFIALSMKTLFIGKAYDTCFIEICDYTVCDVTNLKMTIME